MQHRTLKNGLTLITIPIPRLDSVTTLVAVGAGSRFETKRINGISHFLEHMFFKGSKKYPSAEIISTLVDGIGAINNAATSKEFTYYWIKSSGEHVTLATDVISSMLKDSLMDKVEIEKEKGVIVEELRMYRDNPGRYVWDLYERLQFGDQPLGWDVGGDEKTILKMTKKDFVNYVDSLYSPQNMVLVYAGKIPDDIEKIAEKHFADLPKRSQFKAVKYRQIKQTKSRVNIHFKKTDQANIVLGVESYDRYDPKKYAARVLATILGEGMSSRLFLEVREKRGLAYSVSADQESYLDTGFFAVFAGLKLEKVFEGIEVIRNELKKVTIDKVHIDELKKAKEMIKGRIAIRSESTNFLAEHFGVDFILDRKTESFDEYLTKINAVTLDDVMAVAQELLKPEKFNLQVIGPFKSDTKFKAALS